MKKTLVVLSLGGWACAAALLFIQADRPSEASMVLASSSSSAGAGCSADTDQNGTVDVTDLLNVLGAWGDCPDADGDGFTIAEGDCENGSGNVVNVLSMRYQALIVGWPKILNKVGTAGCNLLFWQVFVPTAELGGPNDDQGPIPEPGSG